MIEITIYLKSGEHFSVFVNSFSVKKNSLGDFAGLSWESASEKLPYLLHIDADEIAAIVSAHHLDQNGLDVS